MLQVTRVKTYLVGKASTRLHLPRNKSQQSMVRTRSDPKLGRSTLVHIEGTQKRLFEIDTSQQRSLGKLRTNLPQKCLRRYQQDNSGIHQTQRLADTAH